MSCKTKGNGFVNSSKIGSFIIYRSLNRICWILVAVSFVIFSSPVYSIGADEEKQSSSSESKPVIHEIHIPKGADKFVPSILNIKAGDTVVWINEDDRGHPVASIPGKGTNDKELFTQPIPPGKSWSHTFTRPGEYPYFCYIHYWMVGVVIVENGQSNTQ